MIQNKLPDSFFKCSACDEIHTEVFVVCKCNTEDDDVYLKVVKDKYIVAVCPVCENEIIRFPFTNKKKESK